MVAQSGVAGWWPGQNVLLLAGHAGGGSGAVRQAWSWPLRGCAGQARPVFIMNIRWVE